MVPMILQILYGIVGFSLWISSLGHSNSKSSDDIQIVMYKNGEVLKENFVYLSIQDKGNFRLTLISIEGDADMYIAQHPKVPNFEPDRYDLHSASCGEDVIDVPSSFKRPIVIGIYGNSAYEVTKYHLRVEIVEYNNEMYNITTYSMFENKQITEQNEEKENTKQNEKVSKKNEQNSNLKIKGTHYVKSGIFGLLEIIAMVL